ncbi:hypothetical protein [uncultured Agrobacterium sp.]|uniref:hypothetical protein n=1 Tax=uncultured Agrobacterium sp. TaxID=157277 RepID=UPI0025E0D917|nr:hypothetical protein [uncultured Agrobacterium sp.]
MSDEKQQGSWQIALSEWDKKHDPFRGKTFIDTLNGGLYQFDYYSGSPDACLSSIRSNRVETAKQVASVMALGILSLLFSVPVCFFFAVGFSIYVAIDTWQENEKLRQKLSEHAAQGRFPSGGAA